MKNIADLSENAQLLFKTVVDNPGFFKSCYDLNFGLVAQFKLNKQPIGCKEFCNVFDVLLGCEVKENKDLIDNSESAVRELLKSGLIHSRKFDLPVFASSDSINYRTGYFPTPLAWMN